MKFLSQTQKEVIAKAHGLTVESINSRIEIWSILNDPETTHPDLVEAQKPVSYTHLTLPTKRIV